MDPLSVLRDFTIRGELDKIVRINDEYRFGSEYVFPSTADTAYRSKQGNLYTLEALIHYVKNPNLKHGEYMLYTVRNSVPAVTLPDRKPLLDYLTGKIATSDSIEFLLPQQQQQQQQSQQNPSFHHLNHNSIAEEYNPDENSLFAAAPNSIDNIAVRSPERDTEIVDYMSVIKAVERPLKSREAILESKNIDFYSVLVASTRREEERQRIESQQRKDGLVAKSRLMGADDRGLGYGGGGDDMGYDATPKSKLQLKGGKIGEGVPIILVPSAFQTLITIYNVKEFLEDGVYIPTDVKVKQMKVRPECVTVQKKFSRDRERVVAAYEVRDKPSALKAEDWERVVAVFVLGKEWQFKDFPYKDHVEIFNKIKGFFMRFEDDSLESAKTVKQWNVKIISISKNKRHQDRAAALDVWEKLEEFVRSRSHS